jgi:glycogen phosphorylase/synthase
MDNMVKPDFIFEVSWEVCNKVGGIYTVVSTKALTLQSQLGDNYILIGPDLLKDNPVNNEFIEDKQLFRQWQKKAESEGLRFRIGRWNIAGNPVAILVDFTSCFAEKDVVFSHMWELYHLDSLYGQWDYIEPALFGYASAKIIESYYKYYIGSHEKIIAQFHEWMTGTGVLYLKDKAPQIGTLFTTHATVLGRCIAGNGLPLYSKMDTFNPDVIAKEFNVISKQSLEKLSAQHADCFTTVSDLTGNECHYFLGKDVDIVTPNGFEDSFVPDEKSFDIIRNKARNDIRKVAASHFGFELTNDCIFLINSGRYEFKNKGIDVFIDALGKLNESKELNREILAVISVPAHHVGPDQNLLKALNQKETKEPNPNIFSTHDLFDDENDPVIKAFRKNGLTNTKESKVKVLFVPAYLDGHDGIFNLHYYDFLIGFDASIFPSYYEPWGYTPLESLAFHIPTITTSLAGFGLWIKPFLSDIKGCLKVIERTDDNYDEVVSQITESLLSCQIKKAEDIQYARLRSLEVSRSALWKNMIDFYFKAYDIALRKSANRLELYKSKMPHFQEPTTKSEQNVYPEWKKVLVKPLIPKALERLVCLSKNLWWTWNTDASELFESINKERWYELKFNPIALLESLTVKEISELEKSKSFIQKLNDVVDKFDRYIDEMVYKPEELVAYFCMEYGLHDTLKIFSGGLGMLAGDYLKEASDSNKNMIGVGLLYRYGYFKQTLSINGEQIAQYIPQKFTHLPLLPVMSSCNKWLKVSIPLPGRMLWAKVWKVEVGRIPLYLLDTDIDENQESDRSVTFHLYGGDWENRLKQELLLGFGGIRLLEALNLKPYIYHNNEGHSAFHSVERLANLVQRDRLSYAQAKEVVRSSTLFTTHTPVPAGHDAFSEDLLRVYLSHIPDQLNISWEQFMNLGRFHENDVNEKFSVSVLATKLSQEVNGVSKIHGRVSREMFNDLYPGYFAEENHIGYVTNGVHLPTWASKSWLEFYKKELGEDFLSKQSSEETWAPIYKVENEIIWNLRKKQKKQLLEFVSRRLNDEMTRRTENSKLIFQTLEELNTDALIIGFARRFATYKRAHLLFSNPERLASLVNNPQKPVKFVFAGKAHPNDKAGQDLIKSIYEISRKPEFIGKIIFIENYDIELAKYLTKGVDLWLNTPTRPLEASGTSGEKAVMNGVLNFSVLDGWWAEGYTPGAGWALKEENTYDKTSFQNELDAETIYSLLEDEIIPTYYDCGIDSIPDKWIMHIKNTLVKIAPHFTMKRQIDDYYNQYYSKLFKRSNLLQQNNYENARLIAAWKLKVMRAWEDIQLISYDIPDFTHDTLLLGDVFNASLLINTNELSWADIAVEVVFGKKENDEVKQPLFTEPLEFEKHEGKFARYSCKIPIIRAGVYNFAFRIYPVHTLLAHRQDFNLVKWF